MLKQTGKYFLKSLYGLFIVVMLCGFDTSRHSIPIDDIYDGGPGKDGIPAILKPKFISAEEADKTQLKKEKYWACYFYDLITYTVFYEQTQ